VRPVVWSEAWGPPGGRGTNAHGPLEACAGSGPRVTALIGALSGRQRRRRRAVQALCQAVVGVALSQGASPRAVDRVADALAPPDEAMAAQARRARVHDLDETGGSQPGVWAWLGVLVNPTVAWCTGPAGRRQAAFAARVASWAGLLGSEG
jgi:hypothetical protein